MEIYSRVAALKVAQAVSLLFVTIKSWHSHSHADFCGLYNRESPPGCTICPQDLRDKWYPCCQGLFLVLVECAGTWEGRRLYGHGVAAEDQEYSEWAGTQALCHACVRETAHIYKALPCLGYFAGLLV